MDLKRQTHVRVLLTDDEIQLSSIDDLCNKYFDWLKLYKEAAGGRKTRTANRRADAIFDEIMAFKLAPIPTPAATVVTVGIDGNSSKSSISGASESSSLTSSGTTGRVLRPRCRTPSVSRKQKQENSPSTPTHQSIRAVMKKNPDSSSSNVLSAALNQQHPSVSVTKIRQLLRADSAQKKKEEERERQERIRLERKTKEERAEAQKKQLLEERAVTAKMKREQRLLHAAEVRKAREKLKEGLPVSKQAAQQQQQQQPQQQQQQQQQQQKQKQQPEQVNSPPETKKTPVEPQPTKANRKLDETFQKPADELNNIDISVHDETSDEPTKKVKDVASWAKAPHLRDLVISQFTKLEEHILAEALAIFGGVKLPVDLDEIFSSHKLPSNKRYLARTSSAVWTPPHKPLKRSSSVVFTPTDQKR